MGIKEIFKQVMNFVGGFTFFSLSLITIMTTIFETGRSLSKARAMDLGNRLIDNIANHSAILARGETMCKIGIVAIICLAMSISIMFYKWFKENRERE